jgi:hypothetical protein
MRWINVRCGERARATGTAALDPPSFPLLTQWYSPIIGPRAS